MPRSSEPKATFLWAALAACVVTAVALGGETIYVNSAATGIEDGNALETAYRSLSAAVKDARFENNGKGGCVIIVAKGAGPYTGRVNIPKQASGSAAAPNKIVARKGERPVFDGSGGKYLLWVDASHVVFDGLEMVNCGTQGINFSGKVARAAVLNCFIHDNPGNGVTSRAQSITIRNCVVYKNGMCGLYIRWAKGEVIVESNTLYGNGEGKEGKVSYSIALSRAGMKKLVIRDNIIIGKGASVVGSQTAGGEWTADYSAHNTTYHLNAPKGSVSIGPWSEHDLGAKEKAAFDPGFVDPEKGDFLLKPDSPCLKAGSGGKNMGAL